MKQFFTALLLTILAGPVFAVTVNTSVGTFDVTDVDIKFDDNPTLITSQVWWGNQALAEEFATLVGNQLGSNSNFSLASPFFSYQVNTSSAVIGTNAVAWYFEFGGSLYYATPPKAIVRNYAIATPTVVPVPAAIWLLGSALTGIGAMSVKRRR